MAVNGKTKGSSQERKIAKILSRWILPDSKEVLFWRSAMSGGSSTVAFKKGDKIGMSGDLVGVDDRGIFLTNAFSIEIKSYKDWVIDSLMLSKSDSSQTVKGWWNQTTGDAKRDDKHPLLIFKKNRSPEMIGLHPRDVASLENFTGTMGMDSMLYRNYKDPSHSIQYFKLEEFLEFVNPEFFKEFCISLTDVQK